MRLPLARLTARRRALAAAGLLLAALAVACRSAGPRPSAPPLPARAPAGDPDAARIVTSDLPNFWRALDAASGQDSAGRVRAFAELYLRPGSPGLQTWALVRLADRGAVLATIAREGWDSARVRRARQAPDTASEARALRAVMAPHVERSAAEALARATARAPRYYAAIRPATLALDTSRAVTDAIRASFRRLEALHPGAVFPDVYLLVGQLSTGGTTDGGAGLLMGAELFARDAATPLDELPPRMHAVLRGPDRLPWLVAHEVAHAQQREADGGPSTLLARALGEGCADVVADLIVPERPPRAYTAYGDAHEAALWAEFRGAMRGTDASAWLYNGFRAADRPGDLGYYVGSRVCAAYYARAVARPGDAAANARRALDEVLSAGVDPEGFLRASGYGERFAPGDSARAAGGPGRGGR